MRTPASNLALGLPASAWAIIALAVALRAFCVGYGLPQQFDPDEADFTNVAIKVLEFGSLDHGSYSTPASTLIDALALVYLAYGAIGVLTGRFASVAEMVGDYHADVTPYFLMGRSLMVLILAIGMIVLFRTCKALRLEDRHAAAALLVVALSPDLIVLTSTIRGDTPLIPFLLIVLHFLVLALQRPRLRYFVGAAGALGLAAVSKYPGAVGLIPVVLVLGRLLAIGSIGWREAFRYTLYMFVTGIVAIAAAAPYLFVDLVDVVRQVVREARSVHLSAESGGFLDAARRYVAVALPGAMTWPAVALGAVGLLILAARRDGWVVTAFFLAYYLFISSLSLFWVRWALPLIPLLAIGVGASMQWLEGLVARRARVRPVAWSAAVGLILAPLAFGGVAEVRARFLGDDTRTEALEWAKEALPENATILTETYAPDLDASRYRVLIVKRGRAIDWTEHSRFARVSGFYGAIGRLASAGDPSAVDRLLAGEKVDYVVLTTWSDRYRAEPERYASEIAAYDNLLANHRLVREFSPVAGAKRGPRIRVLRISRDALRGEMTETR